MNRGNRDRIYHGGTEKSKILPLMTLMTLMDADSKFHHRSTQINTDHCWITMLEIPSHDEKNFRNSNAEDAEEFRDSVRNIIEVANENAASSANLRESEDWVK